MAHRPSRTLRRRTLFREEEELLKEGPLAPLGRTRSSNSKDPPFTASRSSTGRSEVSVHEVLAEDDDEDSENWEPGEDDTTDEEDRIPGSGLFIDWLERRSSEGPRHVERDKASGKGTVSVTSVKSLLGPGAWEAFRDYAGYLAAIETVNREIAVSRITEELTEYWKYLDHSNWRSQAGTFKRTALEMHKLQHQAAHLQVEVSRWLIRSSVQQTVAAKDVLRAGKESAVQRLHRLQQFWPQYHSRGMDDDTVSLVKPQRPGGSPGPGQGQGQGQQRRGEAPPGAPTGPATAPRARSKGLAHPVAEPVPKVPTPQAAEDLRRLPWKGRAARSRVSAGSWNWRQGHESTRPIGKSESDSRLLAAFGGGGRPSTAPADLLHRHHGPLTDGGMSRSRSGPLQPRLAPGTLAAPSQGALGTATPSTGSRPNSAGLRHRGLAATAPAIMEELHTPPDAGVTLRVDRTIRMGVLSNAEDDLVDARPLSSPACEGRHSGLHQPRWWNQHQGATHPEAYTLPRSLMRRSPSLPGVKAPRNSLQGGMLAGPRHSLLGGPANAIILPMDLLRGAGQRRTNGWLEEVEYDEAGISLKAASAQAVPWREASALNQDPYSPARQYLLACQQNGIVPTPIPFVTGHSMKLQAEVLGDAELAAVANVLGSKAVEEVDLEDNAVVSEAVIVQVVQALLGGAASPVMRRLSFRRCRKVGQCMCACTSSKWCGCTPRGSCRQRCPMYWIVRLLTEPTGVRNLRHLDISHVELSGKHHLPLCQAVGDHHAVQTVILAEIGLGKRGGISRSSLVKGCVEALVGNPAIKWLDLSWNCFDAAVFAHLGRVIVNTGLLQSLVVAHCSSAMSAVETITPAAHLLEQLGRGSPLSRLDVTANRLDFRGALILEDALESSSNLFELIIQENPLGVLGLRCLFRMLTQSSCGLMNIRCSDCFVGLRDSSDANPEFAQMFSKTNPSGRYSLELHRPYHRALLRMLYKSCEHWSYPPDLAFKEMFANPPFKHPVKDRWGVLEVPTAGQLRFTFDITGALETCLQGVADFDFSVFLERRLRFVRTEPDAKKVVPLLAHFKHSRGSESELRVMLDAITKDFFFSYPHIVQLCQDRTLATEYVARLLPSVSGGSGGRFLCFRQLPSLGSCVEVIKQMRNHFIFNPENPTGRYRLDLALAADFAIAEMLILLDAWESLVGRKLKRMDVSQLGNYSQARNVSYRRQPLEAEKITVWTLPEFDTLELDYASAKRPPVNATVLIEPVFRSILLALQRDGLKPEEQLQALRVVSHLMYMTALQTRELLGLFRDGPARIECMVILFTRITDPYNSKIFHVRCFHDAEEREKLRERLGYASHFPFVQPEQAFFRLNFKVYEQRLAVMLIRQLADAEEPMNITNPTLIDKNGKAEPMQLMPFAWADTNNIPAEGILEVSYNCAPESRQISKRRELMQKYGFWPVSVKEEDITWWSAVSDTPEDVLKFVDFLTLKSDDVYEAYREIVIDKENKDRQVDLNWQKLNEWFQGTGCRKFAGPNEEQRVKEIFRFLDKSSDGIVSAKEWGLLEQIWQELKLCMHEFANFLMRKFHGSWAEAWLHLDEDRNGFVDVQEWERAIERLHFYGPSRNVFRSLDKDSNDRISPQEFALLKRFAGHRSKSVIHSKFATRER